MCRTNGTQAATAGQHSAGGKQQTHSLESEVSQPRNMGTYQKVYTLFPVNSQRVNPIEVKVVVNRAEMVMDLDTGAAVSVISEQTYRSTWPHCQPSTIKLHTYSGEELEMLGSIPVQVNYQGPQEELPLLVVRGTGASLLGRNWLQKIRLDWQGIRQLQQLPALQGILQRYIEVFEDVLGEVKGTEARIDVDPQAPPRFHKARPVPFALRDMDGCVLWGARVVVPPPGREPVLQELHETPILAFQR